MQFYDDTNKSGICQEIDRLCDTSDTDYTRLAKTSRVNESMEQLVGDIITADGTFQYDATNYTTLPRGTGTLIEGQEAYSFSSEYLQIESVEILDKDGLMYRKIKSIDNVDLGGLGPQEYFGVESDGSPQVGVVQFYDTLGDTIILYPAPTATSHTLASGLRIWFKRKPQAFTAASDTSADSTEPGLPSSYHVILAYMASIPYCMAYHKDRVPLYEKKVDEMKRAVLRYYGLRERDRKKIMTHKKILFL